MKNAVKQYVEKGIYHVYNRGVNKNSIFFNKNDFRIFVRLLDRYLIEPRNKGFVSHKIYFDRIKLYAFCLLENHFHLLLEQKDNAAMGDFMKSLITSFTMRINKKNNRTGHLFQGVYKARLIEDDIDLIGMSRYIHLNPKDLSADPMNYYYSSIGNYTGRRRWDFIDSSRVLVLFGESKPAYQSFLRD